MKKTLTGISALAALSLAATSAQAQNVTFESTLGPPNLVGGVGPDGAGGGAYWTATSTITTEGSGKSTTTGICVGMNQPSGAIFDRHVTCTSKGEGGEIGIIMGYMKGAKGSGEMTCTGMVVGKTGEAKGHQGLITEHYKFNTDGSGGTTTGTGQWTK
ncbi:MAG: hypothetical protein ABJN65_08890 [Parasphingorhabdus sp.]